MNPILKLQLSAAALSLGIAAGYYAAAGAALLSAQLGRRLHKRSESARLAELARLRFARANNLLGAALMLTGLGLFTGVRRARSLQSARVRSNRSRG